MLGRSLRARLRNGRCFTSECISYRCMFPRPGLRFCARRIPIALGFGRFALGFKRPKVLQHCHVNQRIFEDECLSQCALIVLINIALGSLGQLCDRFLSHLAASQKAFAGLKHWRGLFEQKIRLLGANIVFPRHRLALKEFLTSIAGSALNFLNPAAALLGHAETVMRLQVPGRGERVRGPALLVLSLFIMEFAGHRNLLMQG